MHDLAGNRVLITGSTSGIGAAVARGFARWGAAVCIHGLGDPGAGRRIVAEIEAAGGKAHLVQGDITAPGAAADIVNGAAEALGGLDVLVNNAGAIPVRATVADFEDKLYDGIMDLNLRAVFAATKAAYPHLRAAGGGAIVNTGSVSGRTGGPGGSAIYAAAKAAVHSLTRTAAKEFAADNIRVNAVLPGVVETPFHVATTEAMKEAVRRATPMGRLGTPEDLVGAYLFLASASMSGFITGQMIDVNGGLSIV
jgi:3-oxoacyl-[acyl-carrier protein] reductase